jgi:hypothetical protein
MLLAGILIITNPEIIFKLLRDNSEKIWLHIVAIIVRLLLGVLLIIQASFSKFPLAINIIGWIAIFAAIVLTVIGRKRFKHLMSLAFSLIKPFGRISGVLGLCFGLFLIYAFI